MRLRSRLALALAVVVLSGGLGAKADALPPVVGGALASDNVSFVGRIPDPGAVGARFIGNTMYVTTVSGVRIYDVSAGMPVLLGALALPHWENEDVDTNGSILLVSSDQFIGGVNLLYVVDVSDPTRPQLTGPPITLTNSHTATCINDCTYAWTGGGQIVDVVDLRTPSAPERVGSFRPGGQVHDVQVDSQGVAWISSTAGLFGYDTTDPVSPRLIVANRVGTSGGFENDFIIHNSLRPNATKAEATSMADNRIDPGELVLVSEENWLSAYNGMCNRDGRFQTGWYHQSASGLRVDRLDSFRLSNGTISTAQKPTGLTCSSHYFDERSSIASVAWYEQGVRFLDVSDPRDIRQVGYWMPVSSQAWSALFHGDYVYVLDAERGIDVLQFAGSAGDPTVLATRYNAAVPTLPHPAFGFSCRII